MACSPYDAAPQGDRVKTSEPGRLTIEVLRDLIAAGEIDTVLVAVADLQGRLQGKRCDATWFLDEVLVHGTEACGYVLASDVDMATVDGYALASWDVGYGDVALHPDLSTLRRVPWHEATAIVLCDVATTHGDPVAVSPRQVLQRQAARLAERGWSALAATELEFCVFAESYEDAWALGYRTLTPANTYNVDYSLLGTGRIEGLLGRIRREMRDAGMAVESAKGECHPGQHEITFRYADLVDKADEHSVFKLGAKEIAAQEGCSLTFMAKFDEHEGNSCHIHLSLRDRDGRPTFSGDRANGFSEDFEHFVAGLVAYGRECALLFAPNVNSYKRYVESSFAPTVLCWGMDNRTCAFRVVGEGASLRVEARVPGGDVNPYLALAAMVAAGLAGIEESLVLPEPVADNAYAHDAERMPATLEEAASLLDSSAMARRALGDPVVDHLVRAAHVELEAFRSSVTDWERVRGFERL
jgi:glutamine synthetase